MRSLCHSFANPFYRRNNGIVLAKHVWGGFSSHKVHSANPNHQHKHLLWDCGKGYDWAHTQLWCKQQKSEIKPRNTDEQWCDRIAWCRNVDVLESDTYCYLWGGQHWGWQGYQHDGIRSSASCQSACCSSSLTLSKSSVEFQIHLNPAREALNDGIWPDHGTDITDEANVLNCFCVIP